MIQKTNQELLSLVEKARTGDADSLEAIVESVQDMVFNLSLRMLGSFADAEDATQDILLKVVSRLSSFRGESAFATWVYSIAANHLKSWKKHQFAEHPLSFEFYGFDIENGKASDCPDLTQNVDRAILAEELKLSCTNVMLQCLDAQSRCIFILGTMFHLDSRIAGDILGMTPEAYRQKLSRIRKRMADFLSEYCSEYGGGKCKCAKRVQYAIQNHRINPSHLDYVNAVEISAGTLAEVKQAMENTDDLAQYFAFCKVWQSPEALKRQVLDFLRSASAATIQDA